MRDLFSQSDEMVRELLAYLSAIEELLQVKSRAAADDSDFLSEF